MSDSLAEYISNLLQQGYSEAQVRTYLQQQNYPLSLIDTAFTSISYEPKEKAPKKVKTSTSDQLASYIRTYLAQGYGTEDLKSTLLADGYNAKDIDKAIRKATGTQRVEHHIPAATVIKILFILIVVAGIAYGFLLLKGNMVTPSSPVNEQTRLLDLALTLDAAAVEPGNTIHATASVTNMGSAERYDVELTYELYDTKGTRLWSERVTKAVSTTFEDSQTVPSAELPVGSYELSVTAAYGGDDTATAARTITISETPEEVPEEPEPVVVPKEQPPIIISDNPDTASDDAFRAARSGDSASAEGFCLGIRNQAARDDCLNRIVGEDRQSSHCAAMTSTGMRDNCYLSFALEGDYELCEKLQEEESLRLCNDLKRIEGLENKTLNTTGFFS
ncbi:hypothetical protein GOV07_03720 [Candidatus Woesearchaeota archaeon]|nr:hypothetical protein [Candidatus Woesearchaeota archaeon]